VHCGFKATVLHNGESLVICEKEGVAEPISFAHLELFVPTMQEDVCAIAEITLEQFEELRTKLCDPDLDFDSLN
jgi:hypothetical protein